MSSHLAFRRGRVFAVLALLLAASPAFAQQCPPQAFIQAVAQEVNEGVTVRPNGNSSKGTNATYLWQQVSGPGPITFSDPTGANTSFVAPQVTGDQQLVIRLTVTGCNPRTSHSTDAIVTIRDLDAPPSNTKPTAIATATPPIASAGQTVTLDGSQSTDPQNNIQSYLWEQLEGPTVTLANANAASATFTAPNLTAGATLKFRLTVTDIGGLQNQAEVVVSVVFENDSPFAKLTCPDTVQEGQSVTLDASGSSDFEDGTALSYAWSQLDGPPNIPVSDETGSQVTFDAPVLGTGDVGFVRFQVTVSDGATPALSDVAECSVFIEDITPPVFSGDGDRTAEATGPDGAHVSYDGLTAIDNVEGDVSPSIVCLPPSGSLFALGATSVHCAVEDLNHNGAETDFVVTVQDTTPPTITVPGDLAVEADGPGGSVVTFTATTSDIVDGDGFATCDPASGSLFPLGATEVECNATDAHGNAAAPGTFDIRVVDTTPPVIAAHEDVQAEATSAAGAAVHYTAPQWTDLVDGTGSATCLPAAGSTFALGTTTVSCNHTDNAGNIAATTYFNVEVVDTTPPAIAPHADVTATATGNSTAVVTYTDPTAIDLVDGPVAVSCTPASGSTFDVGSTTVTCTAKDSRKNTATSTFNVIVTYAFAGFFSPVDNLPTVNTVTAGQSIPVKFSLGGYQGMAIFALGYPKSTVMACGAAPQDALEETSTAGSSTLTYDPTTGRYHYVWKTEKAWSGTCRQLQIKFADGKVQVANFFFKK